MNTAHAHETLQGIVQHIKFYAKETGYAVISVQVGEGDDSRLVTLSGNLPQVVVGDEIQTEGHWKEHPKYGMQFNVNSYMKVLPTESDTIESYLGSGMIKGLGPGTAAKIVAYFGDKTLDVLTHNPERLLEITGIGEKKAETITRGWKEQLAVQDIMIFLNGCGITPIFAARIYRKYGLNAIETIKNDPYDLAYTIDGIGFIKSDVIARKVGFDVNSPQRIQAGTRYALEEGVKNGNVYYPESVLRENAINLLESEHNLVNDAIDALISSERVIAEQGIGERNIYLPNLYVHENEAARLLLKLSRAQSSFHGRMNDLDRQILIAEKRFGITLSPDQRNAVEKACRNTVSLLTGGPGTGKSTISKIIVEILKHKNGKVLLCAPTGKAAKRLEDCGGDSASTIHRLLEFAPWQGGFQRGKDNPLECDAVIIDEASMVDISLLYFLVRAVPAGAHLIIIGDADQLPSVGPGLCMRHLVESGAFPLTYLNHIYRQAEGSDIVALAHTINKGFVPGDDHFGGDCFYIEQEEPEKAVAEVVRLVTQLRQQNVDAMVLSPMRRGDAGTDKLNMILQDALNPLPANQKDYQIISGFRRFRIGDSVIQLKNDYNRMVFNGEQGIVAALDHDERQMTVVFEGRDPVVYDFIDLDEIALSYGLTVHKSQGSEYPIVIFLCLQAHYVMLARNLFYTAISRAKQKVIVVGTKKAMAIAAKNDRQKTRYTRLKERLHIPVVQEDMDFPGEMDYEAEI